MKTVTFDATEVEVIQIAIALEQATEKIVDPEVTEDLKADLEQFIEEQRARFKDLPDAAQSVLDKLT